MQPRLGRPLTPKCIRDGFFDALAEQDDAIASGLLAALRLDDVLSEATRTTSASLIMSPAAHAAAVPSDGGSAHGQGDDADDDDRDTVQLQDMCALLTANASARNCIAALRADTVFVQFIEQIAFFDHLVSFDRCLHA